MCHNTSLGQTPESTHIFDRIWVTIPPRQNMRHNTSLGQTPERKHIATEYVSQYLLGQAPERTHITTEYVLQYLVGTYA